MMDETHECPKCKGTMTKGFIVDRTGPLSAIVQAFMQAQWAEGEPKLGLFGVQVGGRRLYRITTYRCEKCGYLEDYAVNVSYRVTEP
jgi:hypothetical protein